jgi:hypothetical protein
MIISLKLLICINELQLMRITYFVRIKRNVLCNIYADTKCENNKIDVIFQVLTAASMMSHTLIPDDGGSTHL